MVARFCYHVHSRNSRPLLNQSVFEYIEVFYNRKRLHSALGYKTPISYENERKLAM
ncbi:IS3 family transposase [Anaerosolibacter sp.]|uniref:IS3 family transposase n=1 Tax=Anaerosolibacter sp. TaxID=1872527 RepID=UPI0039F04FDD